MRINSKVVIDVESGSVIERESEDYSGPVALAWWMALVTAGMGLMQGMAGQSAANENADTARAEGAQAVANSQEEAARVRRQVATQQSALRARAGGELSGSSMDVYLENAKQGELEAQDRIFAGQLTALAKKREAKQHKRQGQAALLGGITSAVGSFAKMGGSFGGGGKAPSLGGGLAASDPRTNF